MKGLCCSENPEKQIDLESYKKSRSRSSFVAGVAQNTAWRDKQTVKGTRSHRMTVYADSWWSIYFVLVKIFCQNVSDEEKTKLLGQMSYEG